MCASLAGGLTAAPPELDSLVPRPRLTRLLGQTSRTLVGVVVAPSGYGKTTFLQQWAHDDHRACAWLALRREDAAPVRLLDAITKRLRCVQPETPVALVLDRAEVLSARSAEVLLTVARELPAGSMLVISSTCEPKLPIGQLRLEGSLREVRTGDLAMTAIEGQQLLQRSGVLLDADQLATLMRITEGWPAGLSLAALALRGTDARTAALEAFGGDDRVVADYLRDVFLEDLPDDQLELLVRTSVLDELTGPLCDAVAGRQGSGRVLRELSRSNILIEALDRREQTFRIHPLLRGLLRSELHRAGRQRERPSHLRAASWFEANGDSEHAAAHAAAAGDVEHAGRLLWDLAPAAALEGRASSLRDCLCRFTPAQVVAAPALALCTAVCGLERGNRDDVEHWTDVAERALASSGANDAAAFTAGIAVLRATVARDGLAQMAADARRGYGLATGHVAWRALACFLEGAARHLAGELDPARERLVEGSRIGALGAPVAQMLCHGQLALIDLIGESWHEGGRHAELARECVHGDGLDQHPVSALPYAVSALACAHDGRVEQARREVADARRLLKPLTGAPPWFAAEIHVALARAELRLSDAAAARDLLTSAGRLLRQCPEATVVRAAIDDAWERADSFAAAAVVGVSALTTAELRVLRMLPTHMSLSEIATRLHVSMNTVKTQAHAVYRKLDVSSRSEAVARARTVGLIDR